jgi:hypothetical protein
MSNQILTGSALWQTQVQAFFLDGRSVEPGLGEKNRFCGSMTFVRGPFHTVRFRHAPNRRHPGELVANLGFTHQSWKDFYATRVVTQSRLNALARPLTRNSTGSR